jgi:ubiquitin-protein ligase
VGALREAIVWTVPERIAVVPYSQRDRVYPVVIAASNDYREFVIRRGIEECGAHISVFQIEAERVDRLRVFLPSRIHGNKEGRVFWDLIVEFPGDYPFVPPVLRFLAVPGLLPVYISGLGRVDLSKVITFRERPVYHPAMSLWEVIYRLYRVMEDPRNWGEEGWSGKRLMAAVAKWEVPRPLRDLVDFVQIVGHLPPGEKRMSLPKMEFPIAYSQISWKPIDTEENFVCIDGIIHLRSEKLPAPE